MRDRLGSTMPIVISTRRWPSHTDGRSIYPMRTLLRGFWK
jgi:hypothetical protein